MESMAGSTRGSKRYRRAKSDINMTPMIDVMLVLLIIFMVAAPLMTSGIALDLPKVGGKALEGDDISVSISVDKDGYYYIGENEVPQEAIVDKLTAIRGTNSDITVTIAGDTASEYGRVIGLMALLKEAGFEKVGLKTEARPAKKGR